MSRLWGWLGGRRRDEGGAILVFVAGSMAVLVGSTALAIDIGRLADRNRDLQAVADVIALDAVRALDNGLEAVEDAVEESAGRNDFPSAQLTVELGSKDGENAFVAGGSPTNAVRVTARDTVNFSFRPGTRDTSRRAVAVESAAAGFSVGSFLASIPAGGNTVLSEIFGDAFGVNVLNYDGLATANVTLEDIGLNFPVQALSPYELLTTDVSLQNFFIASADAVAGSNVAAANILNAMAADVSSSATINLGQTLVLEQGGEAAAAAAQLNVLQILTGAAFVMDGTHTVSIPKATLGLAGLGDVEVALQVTEPAKTVFGPVGTSAETAQVKMTVTPTIEISRSGNVNQCTLSDTLSTLLGLDLLTALACLLGPVWKLVGLDMTASFPIEVAAAGAKATLTAVNCGSPTGMTLTPELQPTTLKSTANIQLSQAAIGPVLQATATLDASLVSTPGDQTFTEAQFGTPRTVGSSAIGLGSTTPLTIGSVSLVGNGIPLGAVLNPLVSTLASVINPILQSLTSTLLDPLNHLLGLHLAGADLTALGVTCGGARLAE